MSKNTEERRNKIAQLLITEKSINAAEMSAQFHVTMETIRKDIIWLEQRGIAKKNYGGAVIATELVEQHFIEKAIKNRKEKEQIACKAAEMVHDGDTVILDSGSTVYTLAQQLALLGKNITVFTNSMKAAQCLADAQKRVFVLGGALRSTSYAITGGWAIQALSQIHARVAFLGTSGFFERNGPCIESFEENDVKQAMMNAAKCSVVLADDSKQYCNTVVQFAVWEDIDHLIINQAEQTQTMSDIGAKTDVIYA